MQAMFHFCKILRGNFVARSDKSSKQPSIGAECRDGKGNNGNAKENWNSNENAS